VDGSPLVAASCCDAAELATVPRHLVDLWYNEACMRWPCRGKHPAAAPALLAWCQVLPVLSLLLIAAISTLGATISVCVS
jgi:hypothetical protein